MIYDEAVKIGDKYLLSQITKLYGLEGYKINRIHAHEGGRNIAYSCEKQGCVSRIIRISFRNDRSRTDYLGEVEYVRYLSENGGNVADVFESLSGRLVEEIAVDRNTFFVVLFEKAKGKKLVDNNYRYREGVPIAEYYYNCGKTLGKIHELSKGYTPVHRRYSFFDKYTVGYIDKLIPDRFPLLKEKLNELIKTLSGLDKSRESYGMVHFDFSDGNYHIDFDGGQITVYDFDNSCHFFYMYDLADLWLSGTGWIQSEPDAVKRREFMEDYFQTILAGYRSETEIDDSMLEKLQLFIKATQLEGILDIFEDMRDNGEEPECDEELSYRIKCIEDDIPYRGFFHEIYSSETPFELGVTM